jgi:hypothetical protein
MNQKHAFATLVATGAALASIGCNSQSAQKKDESKPDSTPTPITATVPASAPPAAPGASDNAYAPLSPTPELDAAIETALTSKDKAKISEAYTTRGAYRTRGDEKAGQRVKYRAALSDFRKALEANPKNTDAAAGKNEIEQIYTMMGREIPSPEECDEVSRTGRYTPKDPAPGAPKPKP